MSGRVLAALETSARRCASGTWEASSVGANPFAGMPPALCVGKGPSCLLAMAHKGSVTPAGAFQGQRPGAGGPGTAESSPGSCPPLPPPVGGGAPTEQEGLPGSQSDRCTACFFLSCLSRASGSVSYVQVKSWVGTVLRPDCPLYRSRSCLGRDQGPRTSHSCGFPSVSLAESAALQPPVYLRYRIPVSSRVGPVSGAPCAVIGPWS